MWMKVSKKKKFYLIEKVYVNLKGVNIYDIMWGILIVFSLLLGKFMNNNILYLINWC